MTQQRTELILQFLSIALSVGAGLAIFYFPEREAEVNLWVSAAQALAVALVAIFANWGVATFIRTRSNERLSVMHAMGAQVQRDSQGAVEFTAVPQLEFME
jgi:hypothetical protein